MPDELHDHSRSAETHLRHFADVRWAGLGWWRAFVRQPRRVLAMRRSIAALPVIPTGGLRPDAQAAVRAALRVRSPLRRVLLHGALYAIPLPEDAAAYSRGRAMSLLRNHANVAAKRGVVGERVDGVDERMALLRISQEFERTHPRPRYRGDGTGGRQFLGLPLWMVARADDGTPLVLGVVDLHGPVAVLRYFRVTADGDDASRARYLLIGELASHSIASGARYLISDTAPVYVSPGLHYFMERVGFRMFRLAPRAGRLASQPRRRGDGSLTRPEPTD